MKPSVRTGCRSVAIQTQHMCKEIKLSTAELNQFKDHLFGQSKKLFLGFTSTGILGSGSYRTNDHIFLPQNSEWVVRLLVSIRFSSGKLLLVLSSTVILCSKYLRTHDHFFVSQNYGSCAVLLLALSM